MKCPDCGAEIEEGHLYCEKCGMEIQMVPDFEPEIENSITETLSTVAEEIDGSSTLAKDQSREGKKASVETQEPKKKKHKKQGDSLFSEETGKNWIIISLITFIAVMIASVFVSVYFYHRYSVNYQIDQARYYAQSGEYEKAIEYLEKARELKTDSAEIIFLEANYYYQINEKQKSADLLLSLLAKGQLDYDDREKAYENIIAVWDEEEKYEDISELLLTCQDSEIINHYQQYMAMAPEFGYPSGSFDEVILLKISANTAGKIYYTMDGSNPDENSSVYIAPLVLESGDYRISAIFVNDYGIKSEVVRNWYVINLAVPPEPELLLDSGSYHIPTMIEVIPPETGTVYYTMDGSNPTEDSLKYTGPVPMPLGRSNFKFVTISEEGVSSEIISRSYEFAFETDVSIDKAISNVVQALFDRKVLYDLQGHSHEINGKYVFQYNTIVEIPNLGYYYMLDEYVEGDNGIRTKTDRLYAVEVYTGAPNRLIYDENGEMGLISLR